MTAKFWLHVCALFALALGVIAPVAHAQTQANPCGLTESPSRETGSGFTYQTKTAAWQRCRADHYGGGLYQLSVYPYTGGKAFEGVCEPRPSQGPRIQFHETSTTTYNTILKNGVYSCGTPVSASSDTFRGYYIYTTDDCPAPKVVDASGACVDPAAKCMQLADAQGANSTAIFTGNKCIDGCAWGVKSGGTTSVNGGAGISYGTIGYTGATCPTAPGNPGVPPPTKPDQQCVGGSASALGVCIRPDGKHCYEASTGKMICWTPGETGTKTDGNVVQKRQPGNPPVTPPPPPPNDTLNDSNKPTPTSTTTNDNRTINTTVNNYTTGSGANGGDGGDGVGEPSDGSGGDDNNDNGPGPPGAGMGDPYHSDGKTIGSVITDYRTRLANAPILHAADQFFVVNLSGSCPTWTMPETDFNHAMTLDMCTPQFMDIWNFAGYMLLAIAVFMAFRIAIY